jgi:hypothetical protein
MENPPAGARSKPARMSLGTVLLLGFLILALGAVVALLAPVLLQAHGLVKSERIPQTQSLVLAAADGGEITLQETMGYRAPAEATAEPTSIAGVHAADPNPEGWIDFPTSADPEIITQKQSQAQQQSQSQTYASADPASKMQQPERIELLVLSVTYPNEVTVGDSVPITIVISSETLPKVRNGSIELTLDSPSLDWGDGRKRVIAEGEVLPVYVNFTAGTKATGTASIVVLAKAPDPIVLLPAAGPEEPSAAVQSQQRLSMTAEADASGAQIGGLVKPKSAEQAIADSKVAVARLSLDTRINVNVLTKYAISDQTVHWFGIGGWLVTAVGAGTIAKGIGSFVLGRRRKSAPEPQDLHT